MRMLMVCLLALGTVLPAQAPRDERRPDDRQVREDREVSGEKQLPGGKQGRDETQFHSDKPLRELKSGERFERMRDGQPRGIDAARPQDWRSAPAADWQEIFDGRTLGGWVVKLAHHDLGDNYADTFRVENGAIRVMYDRYENFGARFGHLFYKRKLSHYVLALEYRFFGEQMKGGPAYARLNSGVMIHSQAPETILKDQDWPISVEAQFLSGGRTTMNVCTPGTEIMMRGEMVKAHCTSSSSRPYTNDDGWVAVEVEVLGNERVRHLIGGQTVLQYERPSIGGGVATGFDPAIKKDGTPLDAGYIGLQAESQPVEFRRIRLLNLSGCMDRSSSAYRAYFVHRDDSACAAASR